MTGCDTMSALFCKRKMKAVQLFNKWPNLLVGESMMYAYCESFLLALHRAPSYEVHLGKYCFKFFTRFVGKQGVSNLVSLHPMKRHGAGCGCCSVGLQQCSMICGNWHGFSCLNFPPTKVSVNAVKENLVLYTEDHRYAENEDTIEWKICFQDHIQ
ncbi:hypothetical protein PR048_017948 [Dryococelus australis]|uniref:Uncharacterized protein n=1 Tax=Dryococelus australis TaxID=614101 RepID=A0ABQ9HB17_9NEOP|nr:hypothetical protein PR048_017948 [Dryococelus australis]